MARNPTTGNTANKIVVPIPVHVNRFAVRSQHQHLEKMVLSGPKPELRKNNGQTMELGGFERFSLDMTLKSVNFWTKFHCSIDFSLSNKGCNFNCRRVFVLLSWEFKCTFVWVHIPTFRHYLQPMTEPSTLSCCHWSGTKAPISRSRFSTTGLPSSTKTPERKHVLITRWCTPFIVSHSVSTNLTHKWR